VKKGIYVTLIPSCAKASKGKLTFPHQGGRDRL
jgi:hypothetical protein